ncbi:MAG TPA: hypothetical protein VEW46_13340 [Pyrinomonadaceae bacterium]|nr:hypothetical protein [Pyrinomonadaceae bacterium]
MPNNEEYFQASTSLPLVDINGNWTLYERRVNDVEARYLLAPNGKPSQTLTTQAGQNNFIKSNPAGAKFTASSASPLGRNGLKGAQDFLAHHQSAAPATAVRYSYYNRKSNASGTNIQPEPGSGTSYSLEFNCALLRRRTEVLRDLR